MTRPPPRSTHTATLFPDPTLCRSVADGSETVTLIRRTMRGLPGKDNPSLPEQNRDPNQAADRPNPRGVRDHGRGRLDRDPVVRGNAGLSGAARGEIGRAHV